METMPDVALLRMFSFLDTGLLVGPVRAVCRRWRELAVQSEPWKHRDLSDDYVEHTRRAMVLRILQVAPCMRSFYVEARELKATSRGFLHLACTTDCAARSLHLYIARKSFSTVAKLVKRQLKLGRLRRLHLDFSHCGSTELRKTLKLIEDIDLDELSITYEPLQHDLSRALPTRPWIFRGDIRSVDFGVYDLDDPLLELLLAAVGDTVEKVSFGTSASLNDHFTSRAVSALPCCERLRELRLPAVADVRYLAHCPLLTSLTINVCVADFSGSAPEGLEPALLAFFRNATGLTDLHVLCLPLRPKACALAMAAVVALAGSGRSSLENLRINALSDVDAFKDPVAVCAGVGGSPFRTTRDVSLLDQLPGVLRGLPKLRSLHLASCPSVKCLDGITRLEAPSLERLRVSGIFACDALTAAHVDAVRRLTLRLGSGFHAQIVCPSREICDICPVTLGSSGCAIGMFAHPASQTCRTHDPAVEWRCVVDGSGDDDDDCESARRLIGGGGSSLREDVAA